MHNSFSLHKELAELEERWLVLLQYLEGLRVLKRHFSSIVLGVLQDVLDEVVTLLQLEDDVIVSLKSRSKVKGAEMFVLLTGNEFQDVWAGVDLLEEIGSGGVEDVDDAFSHNEDDVGDGWVLLENGEG